MCNKDAGFPYENIEMYLMPYKYIITWYEGVNQD